MTLSTLNAPTGDVLTLVCLYCNRPQEVSVRARSVTCKFCSKHLKLDGVVVKQYEARRHIETCGCVLVERKGAVVSERVACGSLVVRGRLKGNVLSRGAVDVGPDGEIKGDVQAPTITIAAGASLEGYFQIGAVSGP